jgi:hypothetical protein
MAYNHLHIISFDVPYPPNYGGAIDVFYKIKALSENGVKVILHCFDYRNEHSEKLNEICEQVFYYQRTTGFSSLISLLPYTVFSRKNNELINNLLKDDFPILFEGLMSCYYLTDSRLRDRIKIFREANIEHQFYFGLAKATKSIKDRIYFLMESFKLKLFERKLKYADFILAISQKDKQYFNKKFSQKDVIFIPAFHSNSFVISESECSDYIFYHANLAVAENEKAALYLIKNVFSKLPFECIIAGREPSILLKKAAKTHKNISLVENPTDTEMQNLLQNAKVNILITFQATGMKLKLLNTLFAGKHILVNSKMLAGTGLEELCYIANDAREQIDLCQNLMNKPFTEKDIEFRKEQLFPMFDNSQQAKKIISLFQK